MKIFSSDSVKVNIDMGQERICLTCQEKLQSEEFRASLLKALQCAEEYQVKQWLLDLSGVQSLDEEEEAWFLSYLFPRIMMTMGMGNYMAIVLPAQCYEKLLEDAGENGLISYNSFIIINMFGEMHKALAWLDQKAISRAS